MSARTVLRAAIAYTAAGSATAVVAFLAAIPVPPEAVGAVTADAAILAGWPLLLLADRITRRPYNLNTRKDGAQ